MPEEVGGGLPKVVPGTVQLSNQDIHQTRELNTSTQKFPIGISKFWWRRAARFLPRDTVLENSVTDPDMKFARWIKTNFPKKTWDKF